MYTESDDAVEKLRCGSSHLTVLTNILSNLCQASSDINTYVLDTR